jgi:hypothetical protein
MGDNEMGAPRTLSDLITRRIDPEAFARRQPSAETLVAPARPKGPDGPAAYESEVFNFLLKNKTRLGIQDVTRFKNRLVDGELVLSDGTRLPIEIKWRMNWMKACQAEWQIRHFLRAANGKKLRHRRGGIVVFEAFSADWARQIGSRALENGWSHWYVFHAHLDGVRVDLLRFRRGKFHGFPLIPKATNKALHRTRGSAAGQ